MNEESKNPPIDQELQARIVALVLGEASDFERDELNRLINEKPELAAFKNEIESTHGLLQDVGAGEPIVDEDDWKLSAEKRDHVLAVISGAAQQPAKRTLSLSGDHSANRRGIFVASWGNYVKVAALLCVVCGVAVVLVGNGSWQNANSVAVRTNRPAASAGIDIGSESLGYLSLIHI